jgi:hypothetical protein
MAPQGVLMPLMRSAGVSLLLMSRPAYVRRATSQAVSGPEPDAAIDQPAPKAAIRRAGFGQLGDAVTPSDLAPA